METGYPSIDKPWMKFYERTVANMPLPQWTLYDHVYQNNKNFLDNYAIRYFENRITYRNLFNGIAGAEVVLKKLHAKENDVITFISIYTPELIYLFYATNKIGAVCNMIDPRLSATDIAEKINEANSKLLVVLDICDNAINEIAEKTDLTNILLLPTQKSMGAIAKLLFSLKTLSEKKNYSRHVHSILTHWTNVYSPVSFQDSPPVFNRPDKAAAIFYTGGTTGDAKGVLLSNRNINSVPAQFMKLTGKLNRKDTWLTSSIPFVAYVAVCSLHMTFAYGMESCIELYKDPHTTAKMVLRKKYNHVGTTPLMYEELIRLNKKTDLSFLVMPCSGADKLSEKQYHLINDHLKKHNSKWKICNGYGMTEVSSGACVSYKGAANKPLSVGIPLADTIISAFEVDSDTECKQGEHGEICISGPGVMMEYYNRPEMTSNVIKKHRDGTRWMHTGDIGYIDPDGCVFIDGRIKRMIVTYDGFKVFPPLVEEKMLLNSNINNCCCISVKDDAHPGSVCPAVVIVLKDENTDKNEVVEESKHICAKHLPSYSIPQKFYFVSKLPVTGAGKVDYRSLERDVEQEVIHLF